jgi:phosphoribosyl 1,2-cyclic phosphate phosphodiesterase
MVECILTFLGTGASAGIPMIGCKCRVCTSADWRNKRFRPSALLQYGDKNFLIDSGPDLRLQALTHHIDHLEGLLLTHTHYDHIAGLDELRIFFLRTRKPLAALLSKVTYDEIKKRYAYLFVDRSKSVSLPAQLDFRVLEALRGETHFEGLPVRYTSYEQAGMLVTGYRFGPLAYITDIRSYPETIFSDLLGVEILILSVLKHDLSPMHFNIEEGIAFAEKVGAERTYFTHIGHELEHAETNALLPAGIELAYDGMIVEFSI